jgi:hypothetical protein
MRSRPTADCRLLAALFLAFSNAKIFVIPNRAEGPVRNLLAPAAGTAGLKISSA